MNQPARDPYAALRHAGYRRFLTGNLLFNVGRQGLSVAIAWQIYQWTQSATALGLVGLVNVIPLGLLILPAGVMADRFDRRRIVIHTMWISALLSLCLAGFTAWPEVLPDAAPLRAANQVLRSIALLFERQADPASLHFDQPALPLIFLILFLQSAVRVLGNPARAAAQFAAARKLGAGTWKINGCPHDGGGLVALGGGKFGAVWQRAGEVFLATDTAEVSLGKGGQPVAMTDREGTLVVWQDATGLVARRDADGSKLAKQISGARFASIVSAPGGKGAVIAYERGEKGLTSIAVERF
ncbi:MAG: Enterobactin exporter EntS [Verrucomicrobiota bacterium]|jgi:hypothetical protein